MNILIGLCISYEQISIYYVNLRFYKYSQEKKKKKFKTNTQ